MVECGICLEDYQEGDYELHRDMCMVRLMFRCSLCNEDYVSKEGLWNHLDLHEIVDGSKELHYQEIKAKHKLHQCVLCNDQRAYLESPYWKHVHGVHDGFFLRCSDCGENFRSEKLKNDHALSHCESRDKTVDSDFNTLGDEQVPLEVESKTSAADDLKLSPRSVNGSVSGDRDGPHAGQKRSFRSIAESCMTLEGDFMWCTIDRNVACTYKQKPQRMDAGNFIRHLRSEHPELARARGLFKGVSEEAPPEKRRRVGRVSVPIDHQTVVESVLRMTGVEDLPMNKLDSPGLRMLLDPICTALGMTMNSETTVSHISTCAEEIRKKICQEVKEKILSVKIDLASRHGRHILGINVQFWNGQKVVIRTLAMLKLNERQTAKFIVQKMEDVLNMYDISLEQALTVTCDNGANMLVAVRELDKHLQVLRAENMTSDIDDDNLQDHDELLEELMNELSGKICLVRSAAHTLQLAVTDVVKNSDNRIRSITSVAKNCRKAAYKHSFEMKNIPLPPLYAKTRWGGIYEMILNLHSYEEFYRELGKQFKELDLSEHWEYIHDYKNALQPVYIATKDMQAKHMSLGDFYISWLRCMMEVRHQSSNELATSLATSLQTRLQQLKQNMAFKAALLIDPRFNYISSSVLTPEEKEHTRKFIIATSKRLDLLKPDTSPLSHPTDHDTSSANLDDFLTSLFGGAPPSSSSRKDDNSTFIKQLNALDLEDHQHYKYDIWKHWTERQNSHPVLAQVAFAVMSVPSTQVSVERSFSGLALVLSPVRTKLSEKNLEDILVIKLNEELLSKVIPQMYDWKSFKDFSALTE